MKPRSVSFQKARLAFAFHNKASNLSPLTAVWYDKRLLALEEFLSARRGMAPDAIEIRSITVQDLREFMAALAGQSTKWQHHTMRRPKAEPLSPITIRGYRRALSAFLNWANRENLISDKPHQNLEKTKLPKVIKQGFSEADIRALLKATQSHADDSLSARDKALVLFLLDTGVRASELCGMNLDDVDPTWQRVKIRGMGMRERFVPMSSGTRAALYQYVTFYRPAAQDMQNRVFLSSKGRGLQRYVLGAILRYLGERANVPGVHPHRFRRTAGTLFYENSGNILRTQELLGHSSPLTTRMYVAESTQDLERVHASASPVEKWGLK